MFQVKVKRENQLVPSPGRVGLGLMDRLVHGINSDHQESNGLWLGSTLQWQNAPLSQ